MSASARTKVLYLITKSNWGGAQRYVYDLATHLDTSRYEPIVALGGNGELATLLRHAGIRVITIDSLERDISIRQEWQFIKELYSILRYERPAVLHVNSSKAGGVGTLLGRLLRVPHIIFTAHGWAFNEDRPLWQRFVTKCLHWCTVLLSHRTIAVSRAIVRDMNWPGAEKKMKIIHPGRNIGVTYTKAESRASLARQFPVLEPYLRDTWIGIVAELHPIKRHTVLFQALASLRDTHPQVRLIVVGTGSLTQSLQRYVVDHQLEEHVLMLGHVSDAARYLKAFDICVLPSKSESYGYVLHEAGLAGVAVVGTRVGGIPDIITHNSTGLLVPPDSHERLAAALHTLLREPNKGKELAAAMQDTLKTRTVARMTEATTALYEH